MIWIDGQILPDGALAIPTTDRVFEHGIGLFETLRTWNGRPRLLDRHLARMVSSADQLGLPLDTRKMPTAADVARLLEALGEDRDVALRITMTGGSPPVDAPRVWMRSAPLPEIRTGGWRVDLVESPVSLSDSLARHKTLNYWSRRIAFEQGTRRGFDEVLFGAPTPTGLAAIEGTRTNLFLVRAGRLLTAADDAPILSGIMRGLVIEMARGEGLETQEIPWNVLRGESSWMELRTADEVFLTNSLRGILPVDEAAGHHFGAGPDHRLLAIGDRNLASGGRAMSRVTVSEISSWMEALAPLHLAESWDNVGLLLGDPACAVSRVMTCLTVTPETAREAIDEQAEMIVSHHPVLFRPIQKLTATRGEGAMLWDLARAGIAIYSPHTAYDNAEQGINQGLADRLELLEVTAMVPGPDRAVVKVSTFAPPEAREAILAAAFEAGAGQIGRYSECSFTSAGRGTFFGDESTHPAVGQAGRREVVREWKVEFVCDEVRLAQVLSSVRLAHPYEEPAIDVVALKAIPSGPGVGRVGRLPVGLSLLELTRLVGERLSAPGVQFAGDPSQAIRRVAIMCGAGDGFVSQARAAGADVLLTGESRFHRGLEARTMGMGLIVAGHHATERPGVEDLASRISLAFPGLTCWASRREADPFSVPQP